MSKSCGLENITTKNQAPGISLFSLVDFMEQEIKYMHCQKEIKILKYSSNS